MSSPQGKNFRGSQNFQGSTGKASGRKDKRAGTVVFVPKVKKGIDDNNGETTPHSEVSTGEKLNEHSEQKMRNTEPSQISSRIRDLVKGNVDYNQNFIK